MIAENSLWLRLAASRVATPPRLWPTPRAPWCERLVMICSRSSAKGCHERRLEAGSVDHRGRASEDTTVCVRVSRSSSWR